MSATFGPVFQACYLVEDITTAMTRWTGQLGIGPFFVLPPRHFEWLDYRGIPATDRSIIADVALAYSGALQIELIVPGRAPSIYRDFLAAGHSGVHHLGIAACDYNRQRQAALDNGLVITMEGASPLTRFAYLESETREPGSCLELIEMNPVIAGVFDRIREASVEWDGRDPVRQL